MFVYQPKNMHFYNHIQWYLQRVLTTTIEINGNKRHPTTKSSKNKIIHHVFSFSLKLTSIHYLDTFIYLLFFVLEIKTSFELLEPRKSSTELTKQKHKHFFAVFSLLICLCLQRRKKKFANTYKNNKQTSIQTQTPKENGCTKKNHVYRVWLWINKRTRVLAQQEHHFVVSAHNFFFFLFLL